MRVEVDAGDRRRRGRVDDRDDRIQPRRDDQDRPGRPVIEDVALRERLNRDETFCLGGDRPGQRCTAGRLGR
jgi:hypothetical protein